MVLPRSHYGCQLISLYLLCLSDEQLAQYVEQIIEDPSQIKLKVPKEDVGSCYMPIIHSGGEYDVRIAAVSNDNKLSHDVITVSLGAKYKNVRFYMVADYR